MPFRKFPSRRTPASSEELFGGSSQAPGNEIVAHIDGGARGNPGPAGYGAVIQDAAGRRLAELSEYLGVQTNNFAEYAALLAVLEYAVKHGHKALRVVSDSELLVKQMRGQYKVKNETLQQMVHEARELIGRLDWFQVSHVPRSQNHAADRLANAAMDRGTGRATPATGGPLKPAVGLSGAVSDRKSNYPTQAKEAFVGHPATDTPRELDGVVVNGRVEFTEGSLPDGTAVKIRPVGRR
jgi:ribonuclease HI